MKKYLLVFLLIISFDFIDNLLNAQPVIVPTYQPQQGCSHFNDGGWGTSPMNSMIQGLVCNTDNYVLVYEEHFPGTTLNYNSWVPAQWVPDDLNFAGGKQWYLPGNVQVNNGLQLINKVENPPIDSNSYCCQYYPNYCDYANAGITFKYSSAAITSTFKYGYGIYEIYCNVPSGYLPYTSFWLYGANTQHSNEIDVFEEQQGQNNILKMNVHYDDQYGNDDHKCAFNNSCNDLSSGFHRVTLIYDPFFIYWLVDGVNIRSYYKYFGVDAYFGWGWYLLCQGTGDYISYLYNDIFPNQTMNVILSSAVISSKCNTCTYGDNPNESDHLDNPTTFPNSFSIDSVHYYMQMPCGFDNIVFHETANLGLTDWAEDKFIGGQNIKFDGTIEIQCVHAYESYDHPHSGYTLDVIATNSIDIKSGFSVDAGANFDARIDPNLCNNVYPYGTIEHRIASPYDTLLKAKVTTYNNSLTTYPNPFSKSTTIEFSLKDSATLNITIFNPLGLKVSTLIDGKNYSKGTYTIPFQADDLSSGIYYCNLKSNQYNETKKIVVLKN